MFFIISTGFGFRVNKKYNKGNNNYEDLLPVLGVSPLFYDYGMHDTGTNTDYIFTLTNTGNEVAEDITVAVSGTGFSLLSSAGPFNVAANGGTANVTVRFSPQSGSTLSGSLTFSWPNRDDIVIGLSGIGVSHGLSDTFTGVDGTALTTHNSNWSDTGWASGIVEMKIYNNMLRETEYRNSAAYRNDSNSDISIVKVVATGTGSVSLRKGVIVRAGAGQVGYECSLSNRNGSNWTILDIYKNGSYLNQVAISIPQTSDHILKLVASGTGPVNLKGYVDGTLYININDSSSPISSGHPGVVVYSTSNSLSSDNYLDDWRDYE
jgi:hypothetical protein